VAVIGGGFAGLSAARGLRRAPVDLTVIDRRNHHVFQPLLYQVATAGLAAPDISAPIRHILRKQRNATVILAEVTGFDLPGRRVLLDDGEIAYDYLIVAAGAGHSYFGHDEWGRHAPGLKTIEDAVEIRRRVLLAFEHAEREEDPARRTPWLTFVVVGAGPTGVELAGALGEIARHTLRDEFRRIVPRASRILLLEGSDRVLPSYPPDLSAKARRQLEDLGVEVRTGAVVTGVDGTGVALGAERIAARTVLWAAGVAASPLGRALGEVDRAGRVKVEPDLTIPGHPEVLVAGDLATVAWRGSAVPGVAPAANQMGIHAARNVVRMIEKQPRRAFEYVDKGSLATIGRKAAVADLRGRHLSGLVAWLAWIGIHVFFLIGFRNRVVVMFEWALAYLTYKRSARVVLGPALTCEHPPQGGHPNE
jgi:NADH dehydrogenase